LLEVLLLLELNETHRYEKKSPCKPKKKKKKGGKEIKKKRKKEAIRGCFFRDDAGQRTGCKILNKFLRSLQKKEEKS